MRSIDADALMEDIEGYRNMMFCSERERLERDNMVDFALNAVMCAPTTNVAPTLKWISVKDRLPEEIEDVLVFIRDDYSWWYDVAHLIKGKWISCGGYLRASHVTHWMVLPEPPEKKNGGENG